MRQIIFSFLSVLFVSAITASAQSSRADSAARTSATMSTVQAATQTELETTSFSEVDQDLGQQHPVSAASGGFGAYVIGDAGLFYTSNPSLASNPGQGDMYFVGRGGAGIHPNIFGGLYLDAHVQQEVFQYATFSSLNFSRFNAGGGLDYVFQDLGQLTFSVRYEYERYLDARSFNEFYVNNALNFTLAKQFLISDTQALQLGTQMSLSVYAEPEIARRNAYDFWVGYRWRLLEPLELQTYYVLSLYYYPSGDSRTDVTQNVGAVLTYSFTKWLRVSTTANFGANNSTDSFFDYTVVNVGGTLGLDIRF